MPSPSCSTPHAQDQALLRPQEQDTPFRAQQSQPLSRLQRGSSARQLGFSRLGPPFPKIPLSSRPEHTVAPAHPETPGKLLPEETV